MSDEKWSVEVIDIPRDGSCFFTALALSINESLELWQTVDPLYTMMKTYWREYEKETGQELQQVSANLVRFMCACNVDDLAIEFYNADIQQIPKGKRVQSARELQSHFLNKSTWGDSVALYCFLKSLDFQCGVIILDPDLEGGIVALDKSWIKDKKLYIMLVRRNYHYELVRLGGWGNKSGYPCLTRDTLINALTDLNPRYISVF